MGDVLKGRNVTWAEAEKLNIEILPVTGERIDAIVNDIYQMPAAIIKKAEELKRSSAAP